MYLNLLIGFQNLKFSAFQCILFGQNGFFYSIPILLQMSIPINCGSKIKIMELFSTKTQLKSRKNCGPKCVHSFSKQCLTCPIRISWRSKRYYNSRKEVGMSTANCTRYYIHTYIIGHYKPSVHIHI